MPTVEPKGPSNVFYFLQATWQSSGPAPTGRKGSGLPSWLSCACEEALHPKLLLSPSLFYPQSNQACVCWGNHRLALCHLGDGLQAIHPVHAQGGQINISEKQHELNHFLNKQNPPTRLINHVS